MKKYLFLPIIVCSLFLISSFTNDEASEINWVDITEIDSLMQANPKPIFIDVRADWCGMCAKMDKTTLKSEDVIERLNTNFYAVHFDFHDKRTFIFDGLEYSETSSGGKKFSSFSKYLEATGLPTLVFFDQKMNIIKTERGYYKTGEFVSLLEDMLREGTNND